MPKRIPLLVALAALVAAPLHAAPGLNDGTLDSFEGSLRTALVQSLPVTLVESNQNWGHTKKVNEIKWHGLHPERHEVDKNDGIWTRVRVTPINLADSMILDLRNLQQASGKPMTFDAFVSFDARMLYDRENWVSGTRVYGGSTRARFRAKLLVKCEVTSRFVKSGGLIPDVVFRLRVIQSDLHYDNLVFEHVPGLGGEAAKILGDTAKGGLNAFAPNLERDLLAKANAAIVKAGDTKEVRVSLGKLVK